MIPEKIQEIQKLLDTSRLDNLALLFQSVKGQGIELDSAPYLIIFDWLVQQKVPGFTRRVKRLDTKLKKLFALESLTLQDGNFETLPPEIVKLHNLKELFIINNPKFTKLPDNMNLLTNLKRVEVR